MASEEDAARRAWFRTQILPLEHKLRGYVRRIAPPGADVDDLVHDTLVRAISASNWRQVSSPSAFLTTTARNLVYDMLRRRRVVSLDYVAELEAADLRDEQPDAEAVLIGREELQSLARLVATLPPQCQRVFTLRKIYDLSPNQIAARLGISVSTMEKHLVKAVRICSEGLARRDCGQSKEDYASAQDIAPRSRKSSGR